MTGGYVNGKISEQTEMGVKNEGWKIVSRANLPMPLVYSAALRIDNQVYLFGNF